MSYTLIEPCCGSAALTLHLLGARRAILPYQGSKWRFRRQLASLAASLGYIGPPERVVLTDPGPWSRVMGVLLRRDTRQQLITALDRLAELDASELFKELQGRRVPDEPVRFAAEFLFLQRLAFSGKAVGVRQGYWLSPGFNRTSAYGVAATDRFGAVMPMIPSLLRVLRTYDVDLLDVVVDAQPGPAGMPEGTADRTLVYLDPPYAGSTSYPDGDMSEHEVVVLAQAWQAHGASVIVSEQFPLELPGWKRDLLSTGREDLSPFRSKRQEWITYMGGAKQEEPKP